MDIMSTKDKRKDKVAVECPTCGWEWDTRSKAWKVSCPGCGAKVPIPENMEKGEE